METKVKKLGEDFRTGTIAYYGPDDQTVTKVIAGTPQCSRFDL
jgi:hypothetical protein